MIWAAPAAWALALLVALPLVAHLWSRKRPTAAPFPTLQFLRAVSPVSRRLRHVHEWPLLLLRVAVVITICGAAAGPTIASRWRRDAWRARLHRVIVLGDGVGPRGFEAVSDLQQSAASSTVLGPADLVDVLDEAIAQADRSAAHRRSEVAIVWDGSQAALAATDVADIPARVGVRLVPVGETPGPRADERRPSRENALTIEMPAADSAVRDRLLAAIASLRLPPAAPPIHLRWPTRPDAPQRSPAGECPDTTTPALRAIESLADDVRLRDAADRSLRSQRPAAGPDGVAHRVLARSPDGAPLLRGWTNGGCLMLDLDAEPASPLSWWSIVAAREALAHLDREGSAERWRAADVARANREAPAAPASSLPGGLDTRRAWGLALALLLVEQAWRRHRIDVRGSETTVHAAVAASQEPVDVP